MGVKNLFGEKEMFHYPHLGGGYIHVHNCQNPLNSLFMILASFST